MNHKQYIPAIDIWDALAQEKEVGPRFFFQFAQFMLIISVSAF
jgi:hypothetical protein